MKMTKKQNYIGAFLDGYFIDKEFKEYGKEQMNSFVLLIGKKMSEDSLLRLN